MSTTPSNRGRSPSRPRSPRTTTFHVRGLSEEEVTLTNGEYDRLIRDHPEATLTYVDDDDGELITVGSGQELHSRVLELLSYPPPPPPAVFDIQYASGLERWTGILGTQHPASSTITTEIPVPVSSPPVELSPVSPIIEASDRTLSPERQPLQPYVEDVNDLETAAARPPTTATQEAKVNNEETSPSPPHEYIDEPEPFIASFEAEIQRILEDALSTPPSPRPLSPRPMEEEEPVEEAPVAEHTQADVAGAQQQHVRENAEPQEPQTSNAGDIISDVFSAMMQSMYRVAQDVSDHASRSLPTTLNETAATAGLQADVINTAVQNFIRQFAEQMHTIANEAMASAQQPLSHPNHPVAVIRTFAENVGHVAAANASRLREDLRDVGADAGVEVRKAGEEMRKAADEMRKAASILGREVGKTGRVVGKVAGGAGREMGKVFGEGAGFVSGFAGGLVRNISGVQGQQPTNLSGEGPQTNQAVDSTIANEKEVDTTANINFPATELGQLSALHPLIPQPGQINSRRELPSSPPPPPPPPHGNFLHPLPPLPPPPPPQPFHGAHPLPPHPPHMYQGLPPMMPFDLYSVPAGPSTPPHRSQSLRSGPSSFANSPYHRSFPYGGPKVPFYREGPKATSVDKASSNSRKTGVSSSSSSSDSEAEPIPSSGYQYVTPGIGNNEREAWKRATFEPATDSTKRGGQWRHGQEHNRQRRGRWESQGRRFSGSDSKGAPADGSERKSMGGDWHRSPPLGGPSRFRGPFYAAYPHPPQPQQAAAPPPPPPPPPPKPMNFHPGLEPLAIPRSSPPPPPPAAPMLIPVKDPFSPVRKPHSPVELDDSRGNHFGSRTSRGRGRKRHTVNIPGSYARVALSDSDSEGASDLDSIPRRSKGKQAQRFRGIADDGLSSALSSVSSLRSRRGSDADSVNPPGVTFPGLRKVKTTTDSFGREGAAPTRPWLAPWDEQPPASAAFTAGEDAMRRFPSLSELNDSLFSQTSPPTALPVLTRFPPAVPSPPNPFSQVPGYWPGTAPSPPARNPFAGGLIDFNEDTIGNGPSTLKRLPGGFPADDYDDEADRATPVPRPLPKFPENDDLREAERMRLVKGVEESVRNADATIRAAGVPSSPKSVSVEEVPDESEIASSASLPQIPVAPDFPEDNIEKCVKTLIELGYVEVGTERLRMFSELAGGSVEDAVDMLEEERHNWAQFWQQAERNADPQQF